MPGELLNSHLRGTIFRTIVYDNHFKRVVQLLLRK